LHNQQWLAFYSLQERELAAMSDDKTALTKTQDDQNSTDETKQSENWRLGSVNTRPPFFAVRGRGRRSSRWNHIWLVYSIFMFVPLFYEHSPSLIIGLAISFPLFLIFYFTAWYGKTITLRRAGVGCLFLLGYIYTPINPSSCGLFIFAASIVPFVFETATTVGWILGIQAVMTLQEAWILHITPWSWITAFSFSLITGLNSLRAAQQLRADAKLRLAHEEVEHFAKVAERERIARDLHDVLGHTLSLIVLKSELAQKLNSQDPERAAREMRDVEQTARKALADVRQAISGYRSDGLKAEIEKTKQMLDAAGITFLCDSQPPRLPATDEAVLSLIVREAVTNIVRHSQAKECKLQLQSTNGVTTLLIQDDGRGQIKAEGNGIRGMRERVEALGGNFELHSKQGTMLSVKLPRINGAKGLLQ
jgi:two-component system sensor histidine kinase DesK